MRRLALTALLPLAIFWAGSASPAHSAPTCTYDPSTGTVSIQFAAPDIASVGTTADGYIQVSDQHCSGATVSNTSTIDITGSSGDDDADIKLAGGDFPGIVFHVDLGAGSDRLRVFGGPGADDIVVGQDGINLAAATSSTVDVTLAGVEKILINGDPGPDYLSGAGGDGTGGPTSIPLVMYGGGGDDTVIGGSGNDFLEGNDNDDHLAGRAGNDTLYGNKGNDFLNGGSGHNSCLGGQGTNVVHHCS